MNGLDWMSTFWISQVCLSKFNYYLYNDERREKTLAPQGGQSLMESEMHKLR